MIQASARTETGLPLAVPTRAHSASPSRRRNVRLASRTAANSAASSVAGTESAANADEARIPHQAGPGAGGVHASTFDAFENTAPIEHPYGQDGGQA